MKTAHQRFSDEETVNASSHHSANILQASKGPGGTALMQMLGVFAEFERNIIAERTKLGVQAQIARMSKVNRSVISRIVAQLRVEAAGMKIRQGMVLLA